MANARIYWLMASMALVILISASGANGQLFSNPLACADKIKEDCTWEDYDKGKDDDKRVYCCTYLAYERCYKRAAERHCPGSLLSGVVSGLAKIDTGVCTEKYSFWSPECIYTNYLLWLVGTSAGIAILALVSCILCYCCCCRRK